MKLTLITAALTLALASTALAAPTPEELYVQGEDAYKKADYATAIAEYQASFQLSGAPGLLYDLAQAYRLANDCTHAIATYKQFIAMDPKHEKRAFADGFIRELEPTCGAPAPPPVVDRPPVHSGRRMQVAGIITGGGGVVVLVTGIVLGHHASSLGTEVTNACSNRAAPCDWGTWGGTDASGRIDAKLGYAFDAAGILAIAAGAGLYYLGTRNDEVQVTPVATRSHPSGAVVSWSRTW